jgi:sarcosine/dimethylglycine N-methyltransferase
MSTDSNHNNKSVAEVGSQKAKDYYDSDDSQKFYNAIWGEETLHIGRYDLLTDADKANLSLHEQISKAEEYHELEFLRLIQSKTKNNSGTIANLLDMGCGYGGLLRRVWNADGLTLEQATGCDISQKMCEQARQINERDGCAKTIDILEESYLSVSLPDQSCDMIISMDALLHVGPEGQAKAMQEAARILQPGGWIIFSDIMQQEVVDPEEMKPIYERIHLTKMGTVSNYKEAMEAVGFENFEFLPSSSTNIEKHYGTVYKVLEEKGDELGISKEYQEKMKGGLTMWRDLGTKNIVWGFIVAQKKA